MTPELAIVVPTFKERDNVRVVIAGLDQTLQGVSWEVIFVDDDSPDGTVDLLRELAGQDTRVRCLHRIGRRGLSSACIEGMLATAAPYLAVMDADLQHDEAILPAMLDMLKTAPLDIVIGSRFAPGGTVGDWHDTRLRLSRLATRLSRFVTKADLSDPMSGLFMIRRDTFHEVVRHTSGLGFKILLDLFASAPRPLRFKEVPYRFRERKAGESKLDTLVAWEFLMLVLDKRLGNRLPLRYVLFVLVGGLGVFVHLGVLGLLLVALGRGFLVSQTAAMLAAMTVNFFLNNVLTYRDQRLRGIRILAGLLSFYAACGVAALINVIVALFAYERGFPWWIAGLLGAVVGSVWNFGVSATFTWRRKTGGA